MKTRRNIRKHRTKNCVSVKKGGSCCPHMGGSRKTRKIRKNIMNTRGEPCSKNNYTTCCPNIKPVDGKYGATNEKSVLQYNNKKYELHTCCIMCSHAMNKLSKSNPSKFKKLYIKHIKQNGDLCLKNRHTGVMVQIAKLI